MGRNCQRTKFIIRILWRKNRYRFIKFSGVFERQNYGIALKTDSPYRELINQAILKLLENGTYDEIYQN